MNRSSPFGFLGIMMEPQLFITRTPVDVNGFMPIENHGFVKPRGGLWTSTYRSETHDSEWVEWCRENYDHLDEHLRYLLVPKSDALIYTIDSVVDLQNLLNNYGIYDNTRSRWFVDNDGSLTRESTQSRWIDFEKASQVYDGIHLTNAGQEATRHSSPDDLYGWDVECTLWFRWVFESIQLQLAGMRRTAVGIRTSGRV